MEYFFSKFFDTLFLLSGQLLPLRGRGYPPFLPRKNGKNSVTKSVVGAPERRKKNEGGGRKKEDW